MKTLKKTEAQCTRCMFVKPRTSAHWRKRDGCRDGLEPHICKQCRMEEDRVNRKALVLTAERAGKMKLCLDCGSLPHRVRGPKCPRCGLLFAEQEPVEPVLRRSVG